MGNISVDVLKNIDFNKLVTKDINKVVTTDVDLDGWLAEAEADAEVLHDGTFESLVQTDTFAIIDAVNFIGSAYSESTAALEGDEGIVPASPGGFQGIGFTNDFSFDLASQAPVNIDFVSLDSFDALLDLADGIGPDYVAIDNNLFPLLLDAAAVSSDNGDYIFNADNFLLNPVVGTPSLNDYLLANDVTWEFGNYEGTVSGTPVDGPVRLTIPGGSQFNVTNPVVGFTEVNYIPGGPDLKLEFDGDPGPAFNGVDAGALLFGLGAFAISGIGGEFEFSVTTIGDVIGQQF